MREALAARDTGLSLSAPDLVADANTLQLSVSGG